MSECIGCGKGIGFCICDPVPLVSMKDRFSNGDQMPDGPVVIKATVFQMQVCVPEDYTDEQIIAFLESKHKAGTRNGWYIELGKEQPVVCEERKGYKHYVLGV